MSPRLVLDQSCLAGSIFKERGSITKPQQSPPNHNGLTGPLPKEPGTITKLQQSFLSQNGSTDCYPRSPVVSDSSNKWFLDQELFDGANTRNIVGCSLLRRGSGQGNRNYGEDRR